MSIKNRAILGVVAVSAFIYIQISEKKSESRLTNDEIQSIISEVEQSFKDAEKEILSKPDDPDTPLVPDPDPKKCVCKGTGEIIQGDGHVTPCPYHAEPDKPDKPDKPDEPQNLKCQCDTASTYCTCIKAYGSCSCPKVKRTTGATLSPDDSRGPSLFNR
jgi:hypothetical protein